MKAKPFTTKIVAPANVDFAVSVRSFTFTMMRQILGLTQQKSYRIQQVVDELFINAVRYGSEEGEKVRLTYTLDGDILRVDVEDSGTGPYPMKADKLAKTIQSRRDHFEALKEDNKIYQALSGRGIAEITLNWVDDLKFTDLEPQGIKVSIFKKVYND